MTEQQPAQTSEAPRLDMPVPSLPDVNWQRSQPVQMIPSEKRMKAPHSVVNIKNNGEGRHVIIDRHMTGHEIVPGQTLPNIEMLDDHVKYFQRQAAKRFGRPRIGPMGRSISAPPSTR
jgi:hypothetical protein